MFHTENTKDDIELIFAIFAKLSSNDKEIVRKRIINSNMSLFTKDQIINNIDNAFQRGSDMGMIKDTIWVDDITTLRDQLIFNFGLKDDTLGENNE